MKIVGAGTWARCRSGRVPGATKKMHGRSESASLSDRKDHPYIGKPRHRYLWPRTDSSHPLDHGCAWRFGPDTQNKVIDMLELRPGCECCDIDLPPQSPDAVICSFECTFCTTCAKTKLDFICPNCGGELVARPRRPAAKLANNPASTQRTHAPHRCVQAAGKPSSPESTGEPS